MGCRIKNSSYEILTIFCFKKKKLTITSFSLKYCQKNELKLNNMINKFKLICFFSFIIVLTCQSTNLNAQDSPVIISKDTLFKQEITIDNDSASSISTIYLSSDLIAWGVTSNQKWLKISLTDINYNNGDNSGDNGLDNGDDNGDNSGDNGLDNGDDNGDNSGDNGLDNGDDNGDNSGDNGLDNGDDNGDNSGDNGLDNGDDNGDNSGDGDDSGDDSGDDQSKLINTGINPALMKMHRAEVSGIIKSTQVTSNEAYYLSGSDSAVINLSATINPADTPRTAMVIITINKLPSDTIIITQEAGVFAGDNEISGYPVNLYPDPVIDNLNISFPEPPIEAYFDIYNITGEEVYSSTITDSNTVIDMDDLPTGMYIVKISMPDDVILTREIIKE